MAKENAESGGPELSWLKIDFADALFSGGTGRSGTTIIGRLLSRHSQVTMSKPAEIKFLTSGNGILDLSARRRVGRYKRLLVNDRLHLERFKYRLFHDWWERESKTGDRAGLLQGISEEDLRKIYLNLKDGFDVDIRLATQRFMREFIDSQLRNAGKRMWIDTTPVNIFRANEIAQLMPKCKFIHMVRDGRDVISSAIREKWGPTNYQDGLVWYRRRMVRNLVNGVSLKEQMLTISLEDLVINKRKSTLQRVLSFLNLRSERKLIEFFDSVVLESSINQGRWRDEVADIKSFNNSYADLLEEFKAIDSTVPLTFFS